MAKQYWLMKSEPDVYSIHDLAAKPNMTDHWDGIRNYQARNFMRDQMQIGDGIFFYNSNANPLEIVGTMVVSSDAYPDPLQFDPSSKYFDEKSTQDKPRWMLVDVTLVKIFDSPVTREQMQNNSKLEDMMVLRKGIRLSITPVKEEEWTEIHNMAGEEIW